ncbi:GNAT family N-acetyltransferase [Pontibacter sp. KCTC 32443]|nr:GNAT family N-acetyltransferase [Pontibacter sp. KCTC 32443]MBC5774960.1 GNAT family N-acetyltransferase [Pontibacter sp. KCTC 32443]
MDWVNAQYQKISFQLSNYSNELIAIADVSGERAGVGRLVTINANALELGGMYVLKAFRKHSIARSIVKFLLSQVEGKTLYCLAFEHLQDFYKSCGFAPVTNLEHVPEKVLQKWEWCNKTYPSKTLLLIQEV